MDEEQQDAWVASMVIRPVFAIGEKLYLQIEVQQPVPGILVSYDVSGEGKIMYHMRWVDGDSWHNDFELCREFAGNIHEEA